ncbi:Cof-type HAD-IIB family hydrolase [Alkalibacter saccharofermentans]|uniref:Cof subfamily of IIB subfamily of haloacid dehalogenase superfamily/HAD-superfamily hydrolase, subfamily IIB n=1 Tax=Alkalibacter saccharofermentans DSM 14828 TaxID=1120975 RepID=A0A1M4U2U1_9FIRM|nr:Cof-type HAD-IIB family hydrolase [Alkalibacter saccharofermentans]SHE51032.1 hypothetical protein SAMN02746064_00623 [Alkalibacter saccharofermentans DSM 14828]
MDKYKMIFSDIDGTILDSNHKVSKKTKDVVKKLGRMKIPFILVSARMPNGIRTVIKELEINSPIVAYSGALVLDEEGSTISERFIKLQQALEISHYIRNFFPGVCVSLYSEDIWFTEDSKNPWIIEEENITEVKSKQVESFSILGDIKVHKLLCMGNQYDIRDMEKALIDHFTGIKVYKSKSTYLEIMSVNASKSSAMKSLCEKYKTSMEETIAFGDNYNDIDMLESAGLGVAMGNALDEVKKVADKITFSNDEDGVYRFINDNRL